MSIPQSYQYEHSRTNWDKLLKVNLCSHHAGKSIGFSLMSPSSLYLPSSLLWEWKKEDLCVLQVTTYTSLRTLSLTLHVMPEYPIIKHQFCYMGGRRVGHIIPPAWPGQCTLHDHLFIYLDVWFSGSFLLWPLGSLFGRAPRPSTRSASAGHEERGPPGLLARWTMSNPLSVSVALRPGGSGRGPTPLGGGQNHTLRCTF